MGKVVVLGSLNVDLVARVPRHPRPGETVLASGGLQRLAGGKGANQAVAAAAAGASVALVGAVGDDDAGLAYLSRLRARGVDVDGVRVVGDRPTGQAWVTVDDDSSENSIVVIPGANGALADGAPLHLPLGPGDVLLVQLEVPMAVVAEAVGRAASLGARVVLNAAPYAALPSDVARVADPVVVNEHEALLLADSDVVAGSVLATFGAAGCAWDGEPFDAVAVPEGDVVDTTGAGDAFCGALAAALASGAGRAEAVGVALAAGAAAVRYVGAQRDPEL
jgi:ribokinase